MSLYQSSLFIDAELELAETQEKSASALNALPMREDFAYCFGRILKAVRGAQGERTAEGKDPARNRAHAWRVR